MIEEVLDADVMLFSVPKLNLAEEAKVRIVSFLCQRLFEVPSIQYQTR